MKSLKEKVEELKKQYPEIQKVYDEYQIWHKETHHKDYMKNLTYQTYIDGQLHQRYKKINKLYSKLKR